MDSFFDNYPYSYKSYPDSCSNYYSTPAVPTYYEPPSWFSDSCYPSPPVRSRPAPKQPRSIPVRMFGSRPDYAVKIQKVFRGFRVRRNVKKILEINRAVDDVEKGMSVELMMRDERERLKVNEMLMGLLFKLDSISGINDAVRVCRKAVIRKALLLQEKVDSLAIAVKDEETLVFDGKGAETLALECESINQIDADVAEKSFTLENHQSESNGEVGEQTVGDEMQVENNMEVVEDDNDNGEVEAWECVGDNVEFVDAAADTLNRHQLNDEWFVLEEKKESSNKLLEKIAEDNQRLIAMVAELCHKNATQTDLITSLSDRVEKLEQAMNQRSRRNKDKNKKISALKQY